MSEAGEPEFDQRLDQTGTLAESSGPLLDGSFLSKLKRLDLRSRKILQGRVKGEKRSKKRGRSVEFADHRLYAAGDDLRFLDWSVYARLDQLMIKLFLEEEDLQVTVLLDASGSMDYGRPNKFRYATQVAAALGYMGLINMNRFGVGAFSDRLDQTLQPARGRRSFHTLVRFLEGLKPGGRTNLQAACRRFALENARRGVVVVISDFMDREGYEEALKTLAARRFDIFFIQVLSPQELDPPLAGDLTLVDAEDGALTEVTVSRRLLKAYQKNLAAFMGGLRDACHKRGARYVGVSTGLPVERLVVDQLRRQGLVG